MDNPVWPDTLPQEPYWPDNSTPSYEPTANTIRTDVSAGPVKQRRRFTAVPETVTIQLWLTSDQLAILRDFVRIQLEDALPFDWTDFRTGENCTYRFPDGWGSVKHKYDSGDIWIANITLEQLP